MESHIIQWNCRGIRANFSELQRLACIYNPLAFCLQETHLTPENNISLKHFTCLNAYGPNLQRPCGGTSILLRHDVVHSNVDKNTNLQVVAVRITLQNTITLCSVYIPPEATVSHQDLENLVEQIPPPFILMGDFNAHNPLWGGKQLDAKGKKMEKLINENDLCLLNDGSYTYLHPGHGSFSAIDLTICDATLATDFSWYVCDDLCGSDHFPLIITKTAADTQQRPQKWKLEKANWYSFQALCYERLDGKQQDKENPIKWFTEKIIEIADESVPKTSTKQSKRRNPWFDDQCKELIKARKKAVRCFQKHPTSENLIRIKICRAQARRYIREAKRQSWNKFVSSLTINTPSKKIWDAIRKMKGREGPQLKHIDNHGTLLTSKHDIANILAETFAKNSSTENYQPNFQKIRTNQETIKLNFISQNTEIYNQPFSMEELLNSLKCCHDTAVGPDKVHYQFLKHLPQLSLCLLLDNFNEIWKSGNIPPSWQEATIIPIPKPGKEHKDPNNYRPIALTSCVCKTMERMVNNRLVWKLESDHQISDFQCGFRRGRCTLDHLINLESYIRNGFIKKEHVVAVFFDLEKAYDTTWKYGILKDLYKMGFRGNLPIFISNFLSNRTFRVQVGTTMSDPQIQQQGVPQGSILSVTLFMVKINSVTDVIGRNMMCSLYVDDICICYRGKNMNIIERQLQLCINKVSNWSTKNGFKFSKTKTVCMHFCLLRSLHHDPELFLDEEPIKIVKEIKFLGLHFDCKMTFIPHIKL